MIEELEWDSRFFGRKIGILKSPPSSGKRLLKALDDAQSRGFRYLTCKIKKGDFKGIQLLEHVGFYLTDIGVTWEKNIKSSTVNPGIQVALEKDIGSLKSLTKDLFRHSRFYHDPFFKKSEADKLFRAWVENSVRGDAADVVFWIKESGFVTCRRLSATRGEIPLIGVAEGKRGKGIGSSLVSAAMRWFRDEKVRGMRTRTQLVNIRAMNFYRDIGFQLKEFDVVMGKILPHHEAV